MEPVTVTRRYRSRRSPEALWPLVGDTDRQNRRAGMGPVEVAPSADETAARYTLHTRLEGLPVTWKERPFRWVYPHRISLRRELLSGPLEALELSWDITPAGAGSLVTLSLRLEPRVPLLAPALRLLGRRRLAALIRALEVLEREEDARGVPPDPAPGIAAPPGVRPEAWARLRAHIEAGEGLAHIRPFVLADRWEIDRREVLRCCLEAVLQGLLVLRWELVCPSCRGAAGAVDALGALGESAHCALCDLRFDLPLDRSVEAVFSVRGASAEVFCIGGPARMPHVLVQELLPAGGAAALPVPAVPGCYQLFVRGGQLVDLRVGKAGLDEASLVAGPGGVEPPPLLAPGGLLHIESRFRDERHLKIEHSSWRSAAATAHHLSLEPRFRRLFSSEVLSPGVQLSVARVALLFTDLSGSTALYTRRGDAAAYRLVSAHFRYLRGAVEGAGGAVVKTIGDAVMAAFPDGASALAAAAACQRGWPAFLAEHGAEPAEIGLRIGVHAGPCYVVNANGILDYFGQTVNLAARIEGQARGGAIAASEEVLAEAERAGLPADLRVLEYVRVRLKGSREPTVLARLGVPAGVLRAAA